MGYYSELIIAINKEVKSDDIHNILETKKIPFEHRFVNVKEQEYDLYFIHNVKWIKDDLTDVIMNFLDKLDVEQYQFLRLGEAVFDDIEQAGELDLFQANVKVEYNYEGIENQLKIQEDAERYNV